MMQAMRDMMGCHVEQRLYAAFPFWHFVVIPEFAHL